MGPTRFMRMVLDGTISSSSSSLSLRSGGSFIAISQLFSWHPGIFPGSYGLMSPSGRGYNPKTSSSLKKVPYIPSAPHAVASSLGRVLKSADIFHSFKTGRLFRPKPCRPIILCPGNALAAMTTLECPGKKIFSMMPAQSVPRDPCSHSSCHRSFSGSPCTHITLLPVRAFFTQISPAEFPSGCQ